MNDFYAYSAPAPLDPSKVKAGDTVTLHVVTIDSPAYDVAGEAYMLGHALAVGGHVLTGPGVTLIDHQPAPEPEWQPGTTGTATALRTSNVHGFCHLAGPDISDTFAFTSDEGVTVPWREISDFVPDESPTVSTEALAAVAHDVLAGPMYEASHAAMHVAEAITVYLSGHGWTPDTGPTAVEQLATVLAGKFGGHSDAYLDVASEVVALLRGESR